MVFPADSISTLIHKARYKPNPFVGGEIIFFPYVHCFVDLFIAFN